jgi:AsmA protein
MRWIFRVFGALAVLVLVAVGALFAVPADRIAQVATDRLGQATGRPVTVAGAVRPTLWPSLGISAEAVSIGNPDWVDDGPMIAADRMAVAVSWSALLSGAIVVEEATLIAPDITLVRAADGRASWSFDTVAPSGARDPAPDAPSPAEADGTAGAGFGINAARITEGRLVYRDDQAGQVVELQDVDAAIALPAAGPAQVALSAQVNGAAVSVEATIDDLAGVLDGAVGPVALALSWDGGAARFDGDLSLAPALDGTLSIVASDFVPLAALAGVAVPDLPPGAGRDRVALDGRVTLASEGSAHLRDATLQLDDNRLALALDLVPGADRPRLRGTVRGGTLAFPDSGGAAASRGASSGGTGGAAGTGWPADPIDVSGLFALDADVALALDAVRAGDFALSDVALRLTLDRGRLVFDIDRIGAYGGRLAGQFVVNGRERAFGRVAT